MSDSVVPTPSEKCEHGWTFRHSFVVQFANGIHYTTETRSCPGPVITTTEKCLECGHHAHTMMCGFGVARPGDECWKSCGCWYGVVK